MSDPTEGQPPLEFGEDSPASVWDREAVKRVKESSLMQVRGPRSAPLASLDRLQMSPRTRWDDGAGPAPSSGSVVISRLEEGGPARRSGGTRCGAPA